MKSLKLLMLTGVLTSLFACNHDDDDLMNKVPVSNAGDSKTITLPVNTTSLTGAGSDADGHIVAYLWSQVSGPSATVIVNPGSASTSINGFVQGTYVFQLMVTDEDGATGVDTASVLVKQAVQQTLTLQPNNNPDDISLELLGGVNMTNHSGNDIPIETWTANGGTVYFRSLMRFDMSAIPQNATIVSANLYLYSYPPPVLDGNFTDANFGPTNDMTLQRVTSPWSASTVTWANQPGTTSQNQVAIPHTNQSQLDLNLDVTGVVAAMVNNNTNYGFLIKLNNEVTYNSRILVSSYNQTYPAKHPKLVIVYQ